MTMRILSLPPGFSLLSSVVRSRKRRIGSRHVVVQVVVVFLSILCVNADWVDRDTPADARTIQPLSPGDDRTYDIVFSDEFEQEGRTFEDGSDPRWTAIHKNDYTNAALHYYSRDNAITTNGVLNITTELKENLYKAFDEKKKKYYADKKYVQSAMLQGWNKFCITGGIVEFSAKLPGNGTKGGLWPALWLLGNLARATYVGSSDYVWPFSYNQCNEEHRKSQDINACSLVNHYGMKPGRGRGAPEIDILETMQGVKETLPNTNITRPYLSASLQIAPGVASDRPILAHLPHEGHWYTHLEYGNETGAEINPFFYGVKLVHDPKTYSYQSDALSANMKLNDTHYRDLHYYRIEWEPPELDGSGGYIRWFIDHQFMYGVTGRSLAITGTEIPSEPMYLLVNTAVSSHWGFPQPCPAGCDCKCYECGKPECACGMPPGYCDNFPAQFEVDYVRVYQARNESKHVLGCSTKDRPTDLFIKGHAKRYMEEYDSQPLKRVIRGGGRCRSDTDCGEGTCNGYRCTCKEGFTGPACLAYDAFYTVPPDDESPSQDIKLSFMVFPPALLLGASLLVLGFVGAMCFIIRRRKAEELMFASQKSMANNNNNNSNNGSLRSLGQPAVYGTLDATTNALYHHYQAGGGATVVANPESMLLPDQTTYYKIDGRLIDQNAGLT